MCRCVPTLACVLRYFFLRPLKEDADNMPPKKKKGDSDIGIQSEERYKYIMDQCMSVAKGMDTKEARLLVDLLSKAKQSRPRIHAAASMSRARPSQTKAGSPKRPSKRRSPARIVGSSRS